ncbi:nucleoside monophosphate kinase [Candidatus Gracilibacteria bacterium]|nr:nucleoside monophosphate kinase [Candidatus Gracilibacteria bacterium]NUJ99419.1 nucleoside monophosphate kinase [Candidatus Gracilibacteria bacterium]
MKLVFTGIQGCGKGTQARMLEIKYGFKILEMGQALREIAKEDNELGRKIKTTLDSGNLVSAQFVGKVIQEVISRESSKKLILDGFVRNQGNKETMDQIAPDYKVVFFNLSKEKAIERLLGRMYDPKTGETFPSSYTHNPKTNTPLIKRADDNEDSILQRINAFVENTLPIVEIQKQEGKVIEINADQTVEKVFAEIVQKLGLE